MTEPNLFKTGNDFFAQGQYLDALKCFLKLREAKLDLIRTYPVAGEVRKMRLCDVDRNGSDEIGVLSKQKKFYIFSLENAPLLLTYPPQWNNTPCQSFCFLDSGALSQKQVVFAEQQSSLKIYEMTTLPGRREVSLKFIKDLPSSPEDRNETTVLDIALKKNYIFVSTTRQFVHQYHLIDKRLIASYPQPQPLKKLLTGGKKAEDDGRLLGMFENGRLALFTFDDRSFKQIGQSSETNFIDAFIMDVDNDGSIEIVACSRNGRVVVYGKDNFEIKYQFSCFDHLYSIFCDDIDEDGKIEILVGSKSNYIYVLGLNHEQELTVKWRYKTPHQVWALRIRKSAGKKELITGLANGNVLEYRISKLPEIEKKVAETYNRLNQEQRDQLAQTSDEPAVVRYCLETFLKSTIPLKQAIAYLKAFHGTVNRTRQYELAVQILGKIRSLFAKPPNDTQLLEYTKDFLRELSKQHLEGTIHEQIDGHLHEIVRDNPNKDLLELSAHFEEKLRARKTLELNTVTIVEKFIAERQYSEANRKLEELSQTKIDLLHTLQISEEGGILRIYPGQSNQVALAIHGTTVRLVNVQDLSWTLEPNHFPWVEELPYHYQSLNHSRYKHLIAQGHRMSLCSHDFVLDQDFIYERPIQCAEVFVNVEQNVSWIVALRNGKVFSGNLAQPQVRIPGKVSTYVVQMIKQDIQGQMNLYLLTLDCKIYALYDLLNPGSHRSLSSPVLDIREYANVIDFLALDEEKFLLVSDDGFYVICQEANGKFNSTRRNCTFKNIVCATVVGGPSHYIIVGTRQKDLWLLPLKLENLEIAKPENAIHLPYIPTALYPLGNQELLVGFDNGILHHYRLVETTEIQRLAEKCDKKWIEHLESTWQTQRFREKLILLALARKELLSLADLPATLDAKVSVLLPQELLIETLTTLAHNQVIQLDTKGSEPRYYFADEQYSNWIRGHSELEIVTQHRKDFFEAVRLVELARIPEGEVNWWSERLAMSPQKWQDLLKLSRLFQTEPVEVEIARQSLDLLATKIQGQLSSIHGSWKYPTFKLAISFIKFHGFDQIVVMFLRHANVDLGELLKELKQQVTPKIVLIITESETAFLAHSFKSEVFHTAVLNQQDLKEIFLATDSPSPRQKFLDRLVPQINIAALSPFQTAGPVHEMFYGRNNEQQRIVAALSRPGAKNLAVIGPRRIGKTSLLQKIKEEIKFQPRFQSVFVDCSPYKTFKEWSCAILNGIKMKERCNMPGEFISSIKQYCSNNHRCTLVLFMDEIDNILRHDGEHHFPQILRTLVNEVQIKVLIAGYDTLYFQMRDHNSPLFNMLEPIELSSLDEGSARTLVEEPLKEIYTLDKTIIPTILERTGNYPNFIQFFCYQLVQEATDKLNRFISKEKIDTVTNSQDFFDHITDVYLQNLDEKSKIVLYLMMCHFDPQIGAFVWERSKYESHIKSSYMGKWHSYLLYDTFTPFDIHRLLELYQVNLSESNLDSIMKRLVLACLIKRKPGEKAGYNYTLVLKNLPFVLKKYIEIELKAVNLLEQRITEIFKTRRKKT